MLIVIQLRFFFAISECIKSGCRFSTIRRLHILGSRESRPGLATITSPQDSSHTTVEISYHSREKSCRRVFSSSSDGKDKTGKGSGNQWSCPKCGNPCTTVERKSVMILLLAAKIFTLVLLD